MVLYVDTWILSFYTQYVFKLVNTWSSMVIDRFRLLGDWSLFCYLQVMLIPRMVLVTPICVLFLEVKLCLPFCSQIIPFNYLSGRLMQGRRSVRHMGLLGFHMVSFLFIPLVRQSLNFIVKYQMHLFVHIVDPEPHFLSFWINQFVAHIFSKLVHVSSIHKCTFL